MTRSDRHISANATCEAFKILEYNSVGNIVYRSGDGTNVTLEEVMAAAGTTYISSVDEDDEIISCGDRCSNITVTQIPDTIPTYPEDAWLYNCRSTVYQVEGTELTENMMVGDPLALIASTSLTQSTDPDEFGRVYGYYPNK